MCKDATLTNANNFINDLYVLALKNSSFDTLDFIYDHCYDADLSIMEEVYSKIDLTKLGMSSMLSFLTCTFIHSDIFPAHTIFFEKAIKECLARGETIERINSMFDGLKGS